MLQKVQQFRSQQFKQYFIPQMETLCATHPKRCTTIPSWLQKVQLSRKKGKEKGGVSQNFRIWNFTVTFIFNIAIYTHFALRYGSLQYPSMPTLGVYKV